jgi:hypothetical protein
MGRYIYGFWVSHKECKIRFENFVKSYMGFNFGYFCRRKCKDGETEVGTMCIINDAKLSNPLNIEKANRDRFILPKSNSESNSKSYQRNELLKLILCTV